MAAMVAAGALIAQQVAGRATRDALFLSTFHVSSLPLVMIAAAVLSALAVLAFSTALSRRSPAQVVPVTIAAGTVLLLAEWGLSLAQPRLAAIAVYLHMAAFGATVVSGFWSLMNERFDPHTARRVRAAEKPSTASPETTAAAIITRGRDETWNVDRKSASRVARPATCWAMSAPAASMAGTTARRWPDVLAGSI